MSFFGFDSTRHNTSAPGFSQARDPFAGLSTDNGEEGEDAIDFEDTYDGLGDQLDETGDAFNDDTFGDGGGITTSKVGKDFDFFGATAKVADAIEEEHLRFNRHQPRQKFAPAPPVNDQPYYSIQPTQKAARSGYEKYKETEPEPLPDLHVDHSIWGTAPPKPTLQQQTSATQAQAPASRKVLSLEEVEASLRAQAKQPVPQIPPQTVAASHADFLYAKPAQPQPSPSNDQARPGHGGSAYVGQGQPVQILQRPQTLAAKQQPSPVRGGPSPQAQQPHPTAPVHPTQILQNPNRLSADGARMGVTTGPHSAPHGPNARVSQGQQHQANVHTQHLSDQEKAAYLDQETKRAKRNHKIWLLSKDNGLMTPQDKNFITRIQLQQLVAATGIPVEHGDEESLNDDFYYQVHTSIRGAQRQNPSQPLNNFAQTYLHQTGGRQVGNRRQGRTAENHMQRMEQQVQRAVEAAKSRPKNPQLVIAGSLGKISYSNAKTPKPLLNIKRTESSGDGHRPGTAKKAPGTDKLDRRAILGNIERVFSTLMKMEDHARHIPLATNGPASAELEAKQAEWLQITNALNAKLWHDLKVHEPIGATIVHPFIAFLSFSKGKKAIPRVFRHTTLEQRTTILTMIVFHLDQLDVVRGAQVTDGEITLNAAMRENIELFSAVVMPSLFQHFNETGLDIVDGVLELIATKLNVDLIAKTRIGTSMLTLILSRAELLKQAGGGNPQLWAKWENTFNHFFNIIEPTLPLIFPGSINSGEDIYVWQLLAAIGVSATPDQQQRLVLAVKDRVLGTVSHAKTLPAPLSAQRLSTVNLFMQSIGLDVELLG